MKLIKVEFSIPGEIIRPFKEKFSELANFSDKQVAIHLIKDEFFKCNSREYFNIKYYNHDDIKEIFNIEI